jgi:quercetin dioxygenase-like cupin family protein
MTGKTAPARPDHAFEQVPSLGYGSYFAIWKRRTFRHSPSVNANQNPWIQIAPGIRRRTITSGAAMYQMRAELEAGSRMPEHRHPQEQIAHVIAGRMNLIVEGTPHELGPGDALYLASNIPHGVETIEKTIVIDTFSPPRDDYLALDEQARRDS